MFQKKKALSENNNNTTMTMTMTPQQQTELLTKLNANLQTGLTTDQATQRREQDGYSYNVVKPPIDCPNWACVLLPCLKHIPSMKAFAVIKPDDAEVLRNSKWIRYDAASLVTGDVIRLEEGDIVPADCVVLELIEEELLVDLRMISGEEQMRSIIATTTTTTSSSDGNTYDMATLYMGGKVVQGGGTAVITAIGSNTLLAKLIREKRFPPKEPVLEAISGRGGGGGGLESGGGGIALRTIS
jgi:magnesium-transporting ATPase (P-type)